MGLKVKTFPPPGYFCDPPSFLPEGVLYSFPGVVKHINAANIQKYNFLYKPHAKFSHFRLQWLCVTLLSQSSLISHKIEHCWYQQNAKTQSYRLVYYNVHNEGLQIILEPLLYPYH